VERGFVVPATNPAPPRQAGWGRGAGVRRLLVTNLGSTPTSGEVWVELLYNMEA